jgi:cell division septum initiation protein DivIVA
MPSKSEIVSLHIQLAEEEENLLLIQERQSQYVAGTDVPLNLIKDERQTKNRIKELEQRIEELERSQQSAEESMSEPTGGESSALYDSVRQPPLIDIATIAAAAVTILSPYLVRTGKEAAEKAAEAAWKKASEIHQAIKARLGEEGDDYALRTLQRFEANPERRRDAMQDVIEEVLDKDSDFARCLFSLLREADGAHAGATFNVTIFGGAVGEVINIDRLQGGLTISKGK